MLIVVFLAAVAAIVAGTVILGWATNAPRYRWAGLGALAGIAVLVAVSGLFWQQAVLALAISSVVFLALAVMLQQVKPGKSLAGGLAAMVLFFAFTWLATQLADAFFFGRAEEVGQRLQKHWAFVVDHLSDRITDPAVASVLGLICLVVAGSLDRRFGSIFVLMGLLLLTPAAFAFLDHARAFTDFYPLLRDPLVQLSLFLLVVASAYRLGLGALQRRGSGSEDKGLRKDDSRGA